MANNTINKEEIEKFSKIAEEWWNPTGKFKPLHKFNPIRISYIRDNITSSFKLKNKRKPLKKVKILDIGWGGGLLSEPMSRLGAEVVGIDASEKNIQVAKLHAKKNRLNGPPGDPMGPWELWRQSLLNEYWLQTSQGAMEWTK